jgi:regulatory protein
MASAMKRPPPSLQARALTWLAQREQSRSELRRKLLRLARAQLRQDDAGSPDTMHAHDPAEQVEHLLDALQSKGLLSEARFVESRVRARAPGLGTRRIELELAQHGLKLDALPLQQLRDSELQRAWQLWRRKFGVAPLDAKERACQARFLAGRGFTGDVIRRVVAGSAELLSEDSC